jgi:hypothetical protein
MVLIGGCDIIPNISLFMKVEALLVLDEMQRIKAKKPMPAQPKYQKQVFPPNIRVVPSILHCLVAITIQTTGSAPASAAMSVMVMVMVSVMAARIASSIAGI